MGDAILAALGIPISFLACFIFLDQTGGSFNSNSLFGLVLVLGIIVDDAIIIVENCYRHLQTGKSWQQAAIDGTREVMGPVFAAEGYSLTWEPDVASSSETGDMGWTSGRYINHRKGSSGTIVQTGRYLTIWKRQANGAWRVDLDTGVPDPGP